MPNFLRGAAAGIFAKFRYCIRTARLSDKDVGLDFQAEICTRVYRGEGDFLEEGRVNLNIECNSTDARRK